MFVFQRAILRRSCTSWSSIALGGFAAWALGVYTISNEAVTPTGNYGIRARDAEIVTAFDRKYLNTALNTTGFGNNSVNIRDYADGHHLKKPY